MTSTRAAEVAEVLWEIKRADKIATLSSIAKRAGFSAGTNGRSVRTALKTVRRDWPHLHWWRAVSDDGCLEKGSEQEEKLSEAGYQLEEDGKKEETVILKAMDEHLMSWEAAAENQDAQPGS